MVAGIVLILRHRGIEVRCGGHGEAAICPLLKLVNDPSDQEVAGEPIGGGVR
jgi:hypothetical protein